MGIRRRWFVILLGAAAGCDGSTVAAVGAPGGVYQPGGQCTLVEGGGLDCPSVTMGTGLTFENADDTGLLTIDTPTTLSDPRVSCVRSYCGTGSFAIRGQYRWEDFAGQNPNPRIGSIMYKFAEPVDMLDKTLSFNVYVDNFVTPLNGQIGGQRQAHLLASAKSAGWPRWSR